ncbi:MAG: hypothetical protein H6665_14465 [Ardenticatenaceae bacterium]|nr:hypothetical protein [Ardenticatenaceae bacterium]
MLSLRGKNGNQFSRITANTLVYKARQFYGDGTAGVVRAWVAFANSNERLHDSVGFVRTRLETGLMPPVPPDEQNVCPSCGKKINSEYGMCLFCNGFIET